MPRLAQFCTLKGMNFATLHFDTYKVVQLLQGKGYSKEEAEGFIAAIQEVTLSGVATKQDINDTREEIQALEVKTEKRISELELKMVKGFSELNSKIERVANDAVRNQVFQTIAIIAMMIAVLQFFGG